MKKSLSALAAILVLSGNAFAEGRHHRPNPYDKDFHRQVVEQEIRRSMRRSEDGKHSHKDEDAHDKAGSAFYEGTWEPKASDPVNAGDYTEKPTANLYNAGPAEKKATEVKAPDTKAPGEEKGFLAKTGSAIGGFFGKTWEVVKANKAKLGGAAIGAVVGGLFAGPFGALLGAFIGGFGGWWVGDGLGI